MKTLIAYATRYGTTEECARYLAKRLPGEVEARDIRRRRRGHVDGFDAIIVAGPIYAGRVMKAVERFCEANREALLRAKVGLFICCLYAGERAQAELEAAFPPWLTAHARIRKVVGGAIEFKRLRLVDRLLVRAVVQEDIRAIRLEELDAIAEAVKGTR